MFTKWSNFALRVHTSLDRRRRFFGGYGEGFRLALRDVGFSCRPRRDPRWAAKRCGHIKRRIVLRDGSSLTVRLVRILTRLGRYEARSLLLAARPPGPGEDVQRNCENSFPLLFGVQQAGARQDSAYFFG